MKLQFNHAITVYLQEARDLLSMTVLVELPEEGAAWTANDVRAWRMGLALGKIDAVLKMLGKVKP